MIFAHWVKITIAFFIRQSEQPNWAVSFWCLRNIQGKDHYQAG